MRGFKKSLGQIASVQEQWLLILSLWGPQTGTVTDSDKHPLVDPRSV